ncbi:anti-sigma factor domain-containing protein [Bacillus sonorensis]|uniref:Anti-sigma-I factor RsgI n=5 Tax=Bacillus sonorensis TaxID=119858 RepID=M5P3I0_9BACI|nr:MULTISPECIES: anti-sigma factor domain-containing protein [Bacillus]EME74596.1 anti-sigma-I factor RsgI [Bacillus sonorensis L12]NWN77494.1 anti-sigma factor domain-containing protein [Bacillus sp. (in: firmicutes)]TWK73074.1 Anti-sigma-I factor RsgI [Bacillus paralicheniformis]ASB89923.1 DNA helicase [Bacillus sonorensis]MCZ0073396.1 anti-sigma factor domain-containing protein [Bacillus sonorensis]
MRRGIIVEKNKKFVTLLTPDGQFLKAKKTEEDYEIGQEITFPAETRMARRRAGFFDLLSLRPLKAGVFSIAAIMLFAFMIIPDVLNNKAYAYMTIDINPSFELTLNKNCEVVDLVPLNKDGKDLVGRIENWKNSDFKEVVSEIVEDSDKLGYVKKSKEILIATVYENNEDDTYKATIKSEIDDVAKKYQERDYKMESVESDLDTRAKAQKEGISTGRYIRSHEKEAQDPNAEDGQDATQDQNQDDAEKNEKDKAVKEEDQTEHEANDEDSETEDQPDDQKSSSHDQNESDQDIKKEEETNTPNNQNPQEKYNNDNNEQQPEEGNAKKGSGSESPHQTKPPIQKEKRPSEHLNQEYPPSSPGE